MGERGLLIDIYWLLGAGLNRFTENTHWNQLHWILRDPDAQGRVGFAGCDDFVVASQ
jgi:hypothetical protein